MYYSKFSNLRLFRKNYKLIVVLLLIEDIVNPYDFYLLENSIINWYEFLYGVLLLRNLSFWQFYYIAKKTIVWKLYFYSTIVSHLWKLKVKT